MREVYEFYKSYLEVENPYEHQVKAWEKLIGGDTPLLLRAPTGSGKTEAVVAPFLYQFVKNDFFIAPRLIYVLPMRVLANTLTERIKKYVSKVSPHISVQLHHGDHPYSPFFMSDIVVTTLDQFVYAFARTSEQVGRHIDVPAGVIASSLVVFDEAHMYRDEFTFSIMRALMEILYHSKVPFVIMTATMPESLEKSLFENILISEDNKIHGTTEINSTLSIEVASETLVKGGEVNLSDELLEKIREKKTLIVVNQVKRAQRVYEEIKKRLGLEYGEIVLLHSRFTRKDRRENEERALSLLPHKEEGRIKVPEGVGIVVATQVLEAGIDFSAELLLTELAPSDSLVQRAGRCARYEGERGEMIIFPVEGDKSWLPYEKRHLEETLKWLKDNNNFNIKNFEEVCRFVNETLDYKANDFEAVDTLIDLYECVLYADEEPENIQVRKDKSAKVIVVDPKGSGKKETMLENGIREILKSGSLGEHIFEVDIKVLWQWFKKDLIRYELQWERNEEKSEKSIFVVKKIEDKEEKEKKKKEKGKEDELADVSVIVPFKTYILESHWYNSEIGVVEDESYFI